MLIGKSEPVSIWKGTLNIIKKLPTYLTQGGIIATMDAGADHLMTANRQPTVYTGYYPPYQPYPMPNIPVTAQETPTKGQKPKEKEVSQDVEIFRQEVIKPAKSGKLHKALVKKWNAEAENWGIINRESAFAPNDINAASDEIQDQQIPQRNITLFEVKGEATDYKPFIITGSVMVSISATSCVIYAIVKFLIWKKLLKKDEGNGSANFRNDPTEPTAQVAV